MNTWYLALARNHHKSFHHSFPTLAQFSTKFLPSLLPYSLVRPFVRSPVHSECSLGRETPHLLVRVGNKRLQLLLRGHCSRRVIGRAEVDHVRVGQSLRALDLSRPAEKRQDEQATKQTFPFTPNGGVV